MGGLRGFYLSTGGWDEDSVSGGGGERDLYSGAALRWCQPFLQGDISVTQAKFYSSRFLKSTRIFNSFTN